MENNKKYIKLKLCDYYEKGKCKKSKEECDFAHGKDDLRELKIEDCINGLKCFKKDCKFYHPDGWNYKDNVKICEYYLNGHCIKENNCIFRHIEENYKDNNIESTETTYSIKTFKDSTKLDMEIENECSSTIKKPEKLNNELSNFKIFVDGIECSDISNTLNNNNDIDNKTKDLIIEFQNKFEKYIKDIKNNINEFFIEDKRIYGINMKLELNKIMSEIILFRSNYEDLINKI